MAKLYLGEDLILDPNELESKIQTIGEEVTQANQDISRIESIIDGIQTGMATFRTDIDANQKNIESNQKNIETNSDLLRSQGEELKTLYQQVTTSTNLTNKDFVIEFVSFPGVNSMPTNTAVNTIMQPTTDNLKKGFIEDVYFLYTYLDYTYYFKAETIFSGSNPSNYKITATHKTPAKTDAQVIIEVNAEAGTFTVANNTTSVVG